MSWHEIFFHGRDNIIYVGECNVIQVVNNNIIIIIIIIIII